MTQAKNLAKGGSNFNSDGDLDLTTGVTGTLPVANGGTGATTQAGAAAAVLPTQTGNSGKYLTTNGTDTSWGTVTSNPGTVTSITAGTGLSGGTITSSGTIAVANTAVTAGSYTNTALTVNAQGQITAASSGTAPVTSVTAGTGISSSGGTTPTITNTGVTSLTAAGTVTVSASTGGITITGTGGSGTVTSVATGNGLSGGTITSTGTLVIACPSFNSVGSYAFGIFGAVGTSTTVTAGSNYSAGGGSSDIKSGQVETDNGGGAGLFTTNQLSGTWKWMGGSRSVNILSGAIVCRVS